MNDDEFKEIMAEAIEQGISRALANVIRAVLELLWQDKERIEEAVKKIIEANE